MRSFLVLLDGKNKGRLTEDLLQRHAQHLAKLHREGCLQLCGPLAERAGAMLVFRCKTAEEAEHLVRMDPFIQERYYVSYEVIEFMEANEENNWLLN